jgi:hypothetical protein
LIGGEGKCSQEILTGDMNKSVELEQKNLHTFIYSNSENTLSFMSEIGFESKKRSGKY